MSSRNRLNVYYYWYYLKKMRLGFGDKAASEVLDVGTWLGGHWTKYLTVPWLASAQFPVSQFLFEAEVLDSQLLPL